MKKIFITILLLVTLQSFAQVPTIGLVNRWNFDGNLNNEISTGVDLDSNEYVHFGRDRFGNANGALYSIYGNGPSVSGIGNSTNIPQGISSFTISFWMYCRPGDNVTWFSFGSDSSDKAFIVSTNNNQIIADFKLASRSAYTTTGNGKWRHIILTYNGSELQIYEGNTMIDAFTINLKTSGNMLKLFCGIDGFFNSDSERLIDDLYFYNRVLSGVEKTQLANTGSSCNNYFFFFRNSTNVSVAGKNDGQAMFSISGPAYPIIANLTVPNSTIPKQFTINNANNFFIDSLEAGNYTLSLVGVSGCSESKSFTIGVQPPPPCDVDLTTTIETFDASSLNSCNGKVKFSVSVSVQGQPVRFTGRLELMHLEGPTNFGTFARNPDSIAALCAGKYKAIITPIGVPKDGPETRLTCADTVEFTIAAKTTSVNELTIYKVSVYPNPASTILQISSEKEVKTAVVINSLGQITEVDIKNNSIEIGNLLAGIYILQTKDVFGNLYTNKFIKE